VAGEHRGDSALPVWCLVGTGRRHSSLSPWSLVGAAMEDGKNLRAA
jgi:hypothetical protein